MKVAVLGLGYVGTVTAAGLAAAGHEVTGIDVDPAKVAAIEKGETPVTEPGLAELVATGVASGRLHATTSTVRGVDGAEIVLVCVGTPSGLHGSTELSYIDRALAAVAEGLTDLEPPEGGHLSIVVRSTVPPGTGAAHVAPVFRAPPPGWRIGTAMCPEFLREGSAVHDFYAPPFVVVGSEDADTLTALISLFSFVGAGDNPPEVLPVSVPTAEALKYACNAFHATKISFANELARIFRGYGVDAREVMEVFCRDHSLNLAATYLRPGFAYGGSCLPKDLRALLDLARSAGVDAPLLSGTVLTNEMVIREVVERVIDSGAHRVALLGLTFKADTDDLRESPSVELAERLIGKGFEVRIYDPIVNPSRLSGANRREVHARLPHLSALLTASAAEALGEADVALVAAAPPETLAALRTGSPRHVIDLHGALGEDIEALPGYAGVGW